MANLNYYKATDGSVICFRASTRTYASVKIAAVPADKLTNASNIQASFSAKPAGPGSVPVVAITVDEYRALGEAKAVRQEGAGIKAYWRSTPDQSWVRAGE